MNTSKRFIQLALNVAVTFVVFLAIDALFIVFFAESLYREQLAELIVTQPLWGPGLLFYVIYALALTVLVIEPAVSAAQAARKGALLGLVAYGTYALTNLTLINGWPWVLSILDMLWGPLLSATVAYCVKKWAL